MLRLVYILCGPVLTILPQKIMGGKMEKIVFYTNTKRG